MKRLLISMAALLAVVGCAEDENLTPTPPQDPDPEPEVPVDTTVPEFQVSIETPRVSLVEGEDGYKIAWDADDFVTVFFNDGGNSKYKFVGEDGATAGKIEAADAKEGTKLENYYAVYPYNEATTLEGDVVSLTLPAEQAYVEGTFAPGVNTMVATATGEEKNEMVFENVCGYIRVDVYGDTSVSTITLQGKGEEALSGAAAYNMAEGTLAISAEGGKTITLNCGEGVALGATEAEAKSFWLVVPPVTFAQGYTITVADAQEHTVVIESEAVTIEGNAISTTAVEFKTIPDPEPVTYLFDAQFNDNGTVTDKGKFGLNVQKMDHADVTANYLQVYENNGAYVSRSLWQPSDQGIENYAIQKTGYYMVDFAENAEFKAALEAGFSAETVFMIPLSNINRCTVFGTNAWSISKGHNNDNMWASYNVDITSEPWQNFGTVAESGAVSINEFHHAMFVYDADNDKVALYIDGQLAKEDTDVTTFDVGERLTIGARSMMLTDDNYASAIHHWCGDIASAKIYNKALTAAEVEQCYNEATIPAYKEILPQAFFDAKFNMNGTIENQGTSQNIDIKQVVPVEGDTPAVEVISGAEFGSTNNIINFTQLPSNPGTYAWDAWLTGNQGRPEGAVYYTVGIGDAAGNADFLAKLNSGYITIEFIAAVGTDLEYTNNDIDKYCPFSLEYFNFNYWVSPIEKRFINNKSAQGTSFQEVNALVPGEMDIMTDMPDWSHVNEFHHFIWAANVKEGMSARVLDGVMRFNKDRYDFTKKQTSGMWIGGCYWGVNTISRPFNGKIVAIRVYDRALGTAEMGALVKNAKPIIDALNTYYSAN